MKLLFLGFILCYMEMGSCRDEIDGQIYYKTGLGLTEVPSDVPPNMGQVHLDFNSISILKTNSFTNLAQCTYLSIKNNQIRTIEEGAFNGLISLDSLDLYGNNMKVLEEGMFLGMTVLRVLNVAGNGITTIQSGSFRSLSNLEELYLTSHSMTTIHGDMWLGLNSVTHLDLQHSPSMTTIPPGGLSNLPKLNLLHLHNNALRTLTKAMFNTADFPDSNGHPPLLRLTLRENPLVCDSALCWMKKAEQEGWLIWRAYSGVLYSPDCTNNVDWNNLVLNCSDAQCQYFVSSVCEYSCRGKNQMMLPDAVDDNECATCRCYALNSEEKENGKGDLTVALVLVGLVVGGIIIAAVLIIVCLKRNGFKLCHKQSDSEQNMEKKQQEVRKRISANSAYDYVNDGYLRDAVAAVNPTAPTGKEDMEITEEGPHQYQPLRR